MKKKINKNYFDYRPVRKKTTGRHFEHGLEIKKFYGQHFLIDVRVLENIVSNLNLEKTNIVEIGCGDGFLTKEILKHPVSRLFVFEIDKDWANYVETNIKDSRLKIFLENVLDSDFEMLKDFGKWSMAANLPYNITFPILQKLVKHREIFSELVLMVQEEVAQRLTQESGKDYNYTSIFYRHFFDIKLLNKILPNSFNPPPKVNSRLIYLKPKQVLDDLKDDAKFWLFLKKCFSQPRRTLRNNLQGFNYDFSLIPEEVLNLRAQQMSKLELVNLFFKLEKI